MVQVFSWSLLLLGVAHCLLGLAKYRKPIGDAIAEGLFGKFAGIDERRIAFWFTIFGVLLTMAGHVAIVSAAAGNTDLVRLVAVFVLGAAILGTIALPKSPFVLAVVAAAGLLASS
jgi:hypothetical protein